MYCTECGKELPDTASFCVYCGEEVKYRPKKIDIVASEDKKHSGEAEPEKNQSSYTPHTCPRCGRDRCHAFSKTSVSSSGGGYGCCIGGFGYICLGPIGLLLGLCGRKPKVQSTSQTMWVCQECGFEFRSRDDLINDVNQAKLMCYAMLIVGAVVSIVGAFIHYSVVVIGFMFPFAALLAWIALPKQCSKNLTPIDELMADSDSNWKSTYQMILIFLIVEIAVQIIMPFL